jgi:hypothetical protein
LDFTRAIKTSKSFVFYYKHTKALKVTAKAVMTALVQSQAKTQIIVDNYTWN